MKMTEKPIQGFGFFLALELIGEIYSGALWSHDVGCNPTSEVCEISTQWMGRRGKARIYLLCEAT